MTFESTDRASVQHWRVGGGAVAVDAGEASELGVVEAERAKRWSAGSCLDLVDPAFALLSGR